MTNDVRWYNVWYILIYITLSDNMMCIHNGFVLIIPVKRFILPLGPLLSE